MSSTKTVIKKNFPCEVVVHYDLKEFEILQIFNFDKKMGSQIIQNAMKACVHAIISNAGVSGAVVLTKMLKQDELNIGYGTTLLVLDSGGFWKVCKFSQPMKDNSLRFRNNYGSNLGYMAGLKV